MDRSSSLTNSSGFDTPTSPVNTPDALGNANQNANFNNNNTKKQQSLNLSAAQVILLSIIFTMLQNLSLSTLPGATYLDFPIVMILVSTLGYYLIQHMPLTTTLFKMKIRLALTSLGSLTKGMKFDLWITVTIILLVAWVLSIWKASISFIIWCFIIWVYNLDDKKTLKQTPIYSPGSSLLYDDVVEENLMTAMGTGDLEFNSAFKDSPYYDKYYSASIGYINTLEKKILQLNKRVATLENDKLEQNVIIYTFNHNLNDKIGNLEKKIQENEQSNKKDLNQIYHTLLSLKQRKRIRFNILKMYIKQVLIWILPEPTVVILRRVKGVVTGSIVRLRGFFHY